MKVILLNGPPRSGKDSAGRALAGIGAEVVKMAAALKDATHALFGMPGISTHAFESMKDEPREEFFGATPRQTYIALSEGGVKPVWGNEFFGRVLAARIERLKSSGCGLAAVTDSGFVSEARPVVRAFGASNVLLVRLHRPGFDFVGDSRSYIDLPEVKAVDILNDASEAVFHKRIVEAQLRWFGLL